MIVNIEVAPAVGGVAAVHDVARPLVTAELVARVLAAAKECGAALPFLPASRRDAVARCSDGCLAEPLNRDEVVMLQSPFACPRRSLVEVFRRACQEGLADGALSGLFRRTGRPVRLVQGDPANMKITFPEDWPLVRKQLQREMTVAYEDTLRTSYYE